MEQTEMLQTKFAVIEGGLSSPKSALQRALGRGSSVETVTNDDGTVGAIVIDAAGQLFAQFHPENHGYRATKPEAGGSRSLAWAATIDELCDILLRHRVT